MNTGTHHCPYFSSGFHPHRPDFEPDVGGRAALMERTSRSAQEAVLVHDSIADFETSLVAVHWSDWRPLSLPLTTASTLSSTPNQQNGTRSTTTIGAPNVHPTNTSSSKTDSDSVSEAWSTAGLPSFAMPRAQPQTDRSHGSVEMTAGGFKVNLKPSTLRRSFDESATKVGKMQIVRPGGSLL